MQKKNIDNSPAIVHLRPETAIVIYVRNSFKLEVEDAFVFQAQQIF